MEVSMSTTTTPPPPRTGSGGFIAAAGVMLVLMGGLIYWKMAVPAAAPAEPPKPVPVPQPTAVLEEPPPPPPKLEAVVDAAPKAVQRPKAAVDGAGPCSGQCTGTASATLKSALFAKGTQAKGCYERALRQNTMLQGRLVINVRVGPKGQVCSAGVAQNSLGDPGVAACVLQMFRSGAFPAPQGGCVDAQVPMNFVPKT